MRAIPFFLFALVLAGWLAPAHAGVLEFEDLTVGDGTEAWYSYGEKRPVGLAAVHGARPDRTKPPTRWEQVPEIEGIQDVTNHGDGENPYFSSSK